MLPQAARCLRIITDQHEFHRTETLMRCASQPIRAKAPKKAAVWGSTTLGHKRIEGHGHEGAQPCDLHRSTPARHPERSTRTTRMRPPA